MSFSQVRRKRADSHAFLSRRPGNERSGAGGQDRKKKNANRKKKKANRKKKRGKTGKRRGQDRKKKKANRKKKRANRKKKRANRKKKRADRKKEGGQTAGFAGGDGHMFSQQQAPIGI